LSCRDDAAAGHAFGNTSSHNGQKPAADRAAGLSDSDL
jgi:hypothetical protein